MILQRSIAYLLGVLLKLFFVVIPAKALTERKMGNYTKPIENHRLEEFIYQDISIYQKSLIGDIHKRIGEEIPLRKVSGKNNTGIQL